MEEREKSRQIIYQRRADRYKRFYLKLARKADQLSNLRLMVFILGIAFTIAFYRTPFLGVGIFLFFTVLFIYLLLTHHQVSEVKHYTAAFQTLNENALKRINGEWTSFTDKGEDLTQSDHPYAGDLDIFGQGSLFQWINTARTPLGREKLQEQLSHLPESAAVVKAKQEAIGELALSLPWCQRFCAESIVHGGRPVNPKTLFRWAEKKDSFYERTEIRGIIRIAPIITIVLFILYLITSSIPLYLPLIFILGQALALFAFSGSRSRMLNSVRGYAENIKVYYKMLEHLEKKDFNSELLKNYQKRLLSAKRQKAYMQVAKLSKLADAIANRDNVYFLVINILTLWDFQCILALEKWKRESGKNLTRWIHTIGEVEGLISLAGIAQINPGWAIPEVSDTDSYLTAKNMGHPLLTQKRVCNDLEIRKPAGILLITGSNMSGKSTLLRTAGLNLVLAYAGAPVCAEKFSCSVMRIYTCMRISDNLEKSISSFYAELLRIKSMVEAAQVSGPPLFFLLDEIFRGTNSQDRHMGAKILIRQLNLNEAVGMVSTHDLELGDLEKESRGQIKNYHFREYYENSEIKFDYKLRQGLSTTQNAMYLIHMAGINLNEDQLKW